jgi:hypothetical protein
VVQTEVVKIDEKLTEELNLSLQKNLNSKN